MMKKIIPYFLLFIILFVIGFLISQRSGNENNIIKRTRIIMGTIVEIQLKNFDDNKADRLITSAFNEIQRIDTLFSTYIKESPVYSLNHNPDSLITLQDEIYQLIMLSDSLWHLSKGAFDISINSLINTWAFNTDSPAVPIKKKIDIALKNSGWNNIELLGNNKIKKLKDVQLNFGAIAKGYAVDRAIEILKYNNVKEALVNAGGEIKSLGTDWVIGIQHPRIPNMLISKIKLSEFSTATSGDYENYFFSDDKRYHHLLNPVTGYPAEGVQSATVIAANNTFADALSTAVFVMGINEGMKLIESLNLVEAMIIDEKGQIYYSSGFENYITK